MIKYILPLLLLTQSLSAQSLGNLPVNVGDIIEQDFRSNSLLADFGLTGEFAGGLYDLDSAYDIIGDAIGDGLIYTSNVQGTGLIGDNLSNSLGIDIFGVDLSVSWEPLLGADGLLYFEYTIKVEGFAPRTRVAKSKFRHGWITGKDPLSPESVDAGPNPSGSGPAGRTYTFRVPYEWAGMKMHEGEYSYVVDVIYRTIEVFVPFEGAGQFQIE